MKIWLYILLLLPLAPLVWEDFRRRQVGVGWLCLLGGLALAVAWMEAEGGLTEADVAGRLVRVLTGFAVNAVLLALLLGSLWGWLRLRNRCGQTQNRRLQDAFGAGDAAFMLAVAPLFRPAGYIWFLLISCVAALLATLVGRWMGAHFRHARWNRARWKTVPLAGVMGLVLAACVVYAVCAIFGVCDTINPMEVWN